MLVALQIIIHQYIQIKRSRSIGIFTHASVIMLNFEQSFEQVMRCKSGLDMRHRVDEIGLIKPS